MYLCCSILRRTQSPAKFTYLCPPFTGTILKKKSNITLLACLFMILLAVSMITLCSTTFRPDLSSSLYIFSIWLYQLHGKRDTYKFKDESTSEIPRDGFFFFHFAWFSKKPFRNYCFQKTKMSRSINDSLVGGSRRMVTKFNLIDKLHTDLANWSVVIASYLTC